MPNTAKSSKASHGRCPFSGSVGYTTEQGRVDWLQSQGISTGSIALDTQADLDNNAPLYYWQLYSLLGEQRIEDLIKRFYTRVFNDTDDPAFRNAFARISGLDHHVATQSQFWIDQFGGGQAYHGGDYRLKFHHTNNAASVMNAQGAKRWMKHMGDTLCETDFSRIDPRIKPCIIDFLRTKVRKYAKQHGWRFDEEDFAFVSVDPELMSLRRTRLVGLSPQDIDALSVKNLKIFLSENGVDFASCREKGEMSDLAKQVLVIRDQEIESSIQAVSLLDAKALKMLLKSHGKDTSKCVEKSDLVGLAVDLVRERNLFIQT